MKRFVSSVIYWMTLIVATTFVACNEFDEEDISRPSKLYDVQVEESSALTDAEVVLLNNAFVESNVDTSAMCVRTDDISALASQLKDRLSEIQTPMMIGFKAQGSAQTDRYAARIIIGNLGQD